MFVAWGLTLPAAGLVGAGAEFLTKQGSWGVAVTALLLIAGAGTIWALSRRNSIDHTNVTDDDVTDVTDEPAGVVTTAIAAVTPPPAGTVADADVKATIPAPQPPPSAEPARPATV
jgi:PiT family inorganic phosphate transporter